jgi:hypothetical protein
MVIGGMAPGRGRARTSVPPSGNIFSRNVREGQELLKYIGGYDMNYQGIDYLRNKLAQKQSRVNLRYNY